jgi:hypothetical protein
VGGIAVCWWPELERTLSRAGPGAETSRGKEGRLREVLERSACREPLNDLVELLRAARDVGHLQPETVEKRNALRKLGNMAVHPPRAGRRSLVSRRLLRRSPATWPSNAKGS